MITNHKTKAHGNCFTVPNEIYNLNLSMGAIAVYEYLLRHEDRRPGKDQYTCHPSYAAIGKAIGRSRKSVAKYVQELVEAELIRTEPTTVTTKDGRKWNGNLRYTILPIQHAVDLFYERQLAKLDAIADKLLKEDSEDLKSMGYAVKATNLVQKAQDDPANIDAIFEFADRNLADNPSETLKKQMTGLKIQGYMLKVQNDPAAAKEMLDYLDGELAGDASEETKTRLLTVKLQVLMMQVQTDPSYDEALEKTLNEAAEVEGLERLVQTGWGALYIGQIRNIAEKGGSIADFDAVIEKIKSKMNETPILGFLVGNIKETIDTIGKNNDEPTLASRVFKELIVAAEASENPMGKQVAANLQSMLDLAELQGKPLTIEGIEVRGENAKFSTADLAGKYYLVDIWSAKDQGYFETLEDLTALYKDFSPKGFEIVGINTDESSESIARIIDVLEMTWPVLSLQLSEDAELDVLPAALAALPPGTKVLVGPEGTVEKIDDLANVRAYLTEKLGEPEAAAEGEEN